MRTLPAELAARLQSGVTTLAHVWRVERADGEIFGFTDHDRELTLEGLACAPATALSGAIEKSAGLAVDTASLSGALDAEAISEAELARGVWDGARVDVYLVDWTDTTLRAHLFAGRIGEVRRGAQGFEAELRGLQVALNTPMGRVFSRFCDADLGDARCGVDPDDPAFGGAGEIVAVEGVRAFRASGLGAFADGWFTRGKLTWDAGGQSEIAVHRISAAGVSIELIDPPGAPLEIGQSFTIHAGCDKRFANCHAKFANSVNFRGFPHMPGNDAIHAGPKDGDALDGSSRFS
jgi:uncharacterized phage protein (TIGR02218 family)